MAYCTYQIFQNRIDPSLHLFFVASSVKPSFHMIADNRQIAENTSTDRQRLYGNTFQQSGDRERSYASVIPAIVSDHMETRLKSTEITEKEKNVREGATSSLRE